MTTFYSKMHKLRESEDSSQGSKTETPSRASVAILLRPDDHICMIRRAVKESDYWSGHMGFPGGREEQVDDSLLRTAIRETEEEIGVSLASEQCRGRLTDLRHPKLHVAAFVFDVPVPLTFILEETEVAEVHWLPLDAFQDPRYRSTKPAQYNGTTYQAPVVNIGTADVWGISLQFIEDLLHRLND